MAENRKPIFSDVDAEYAFNTLSELAGNIEGAIYMLDEALQALNRKAIESMMFVHLMRMSISWLIISLAKVKELWPKYGALAEEQTSKAMRAIVKEIDSRGVVSIRNKAIAHLFDKDTSHPMPPEQLQAEIMAMMKGDILGFMNWLRHPDETDQAGTVFATLLKFRDEIRTRYKDIRNYNELPPGQDLRDVIYSYSPQKKDGKLS